MACGKSHFVLRLSWESGGVDTYRTVQMLPNSPPGAAYFVFHSVEGLLHHRDITHPVRVVRCPVRNITEFATLKGCYAAPGAMATRFDHRSGN